MIILLFSMALAQSTGTTKTLSLFNGKGYDKVKLTVIDKVSVNDTCVKNKKCAALVAAATKKTLPPTEGLAGNPASNYCVEQKGVPRILKDEKRNEYDFCLFKDGSLVDSWELYTKHYPVNVVK